MAVEKQADVVIINTSPYEALFERLGQLGPSDRKDVRQAMLRVVQLATGRAIMPHMLRTELDQLPEQAQGHAQRILGELLDLCARRRVEYV